MNDLAGKTILLTGASEGIGAATARKLEAAGANLIAHYGSERTGAEDAVAAIPAARRLLLEADLADDRAIDRMWRDALSWQGRIDVVVNNAATMLWNGGFDADDETWSRVWRETLQINVLAPARIMRAAVRHYREQGGGILVTISIWAAQRGTSIPDTIAYAASKAAIRAATQTIARGYAKENILAYILAPGVVRTQMSEASAATLGGEAAVNATLAMGAWVPPEDIAELVAFLATGRCRHLTGATLDVNGASYVR